VHHPMVGTMGGPFPTAHLHDLKISPEFFFLVPSDLISAIPTSHTPFRLHHHTRLVSPRLWSTMQLTPDKQGGNSPLVDPPHRI